MINIFKRKMKREIRYKPAHKYFNTIDEFEKYKKKLENTTSRIDDKKIVKIDALRISNKMVYEGDYSNLFGLSSEIREFIINKKLKFLIVIISLMLAILSVWLPLLFANNSIEWWKPIAISITLLIIFLPLVAWLIYIITGEPSGKVIQIINAFNLDDLDGDNSIMPRLLAWIQSNFGNNITIVMIGEESSNKIVWNNIKNG